MSEVGNWVAELTNTPGTGVITLSGQTSEDSTTTFAEAIPAGQVWYTIKNGNNREAGIGTFNGVDQLSRDTIHATLISGAYSDINPTPINLNGGSVVSCTFNSQAYRDLLNRIASSNADISALNARVTTNEGDISNNATAIGNNAVDIVAANADIGLLDTRVTTNEVNVSSNTTDIGTLNTRVTTNEGDISALDSRVTANEGDISTNATGISDNAINHVAHTSDVSNPHETSILKLQDTPSSYSGNENKNLVVNSVGTAVEFRDPAGGFDAGTLMLFQQTSAPSGWTKQTTHNNKALRVVSGTATSGGTHAFSTVFGKTGTDNHTLSAAQMPNHNHGGGNHSHNWRGATGSGSTNTNLNWAAPAYGSTNVNRYIYTTASGTIISSQGSTSAHNHSMDIRVQYVDLIIASKD